MPYAPAPYRALDRLGEAVRDHHDRSLRGFNPAATDDLQLFLAVLRGEHTMVDLRNRNVRHRLIGPSCRADPRQSAGVCRLLKRLHVRGLIAKIPRASVPCNGPGPCRHVRRCSCPRGALP